MTPTRVLSLALAAACSLGCAHKVKVVTTPPGATVSVDGKKIGTSPVTFEESPLPGSHRVEAQLEGYHPASVVVERTETNWWWAVGGIVGCVICYPLGCLGGAALANLGLCPACFGALLACDPGPVMAIIAAPGCLTVPLVSLGSLLGASPLGFLALSEQSPEEIKLTLRKK